MSLLRRIFGQKSGQPSPAERTVRVQAVDASIFKGRKRRVEVVGESFRTAGLASIAKPLGNDDRRLVVAPGSLAPDDANRELSA